MYNMKKKNIQPPAGGDPLFFFFFIFLRHDEKNVLVHFDFGRLFLSFFLLYVLIHKSRQEKGETRRKMPRYANYFSKLRSRFPLRRYAI